MQKSKENPRYPNPSFPKEGFHRQFEDWKEAVGEETLEEEGITEESMKSACEIICDEFPRGTTCGRLLWEPILDDTPLEQRGVSINWLDAVWDWMTDLLSHNGNVIPTRLFVSIFIEPLVLQQREQAIPLYYFVPIQFRGKPDRFLSHGWDSWLRHLLFVPESTIPMQLLGKNGDVFFWLDIFSIVQDPGSVRQQSEVASIGKVVQSIGETLLIVPGHGSIEFALLPARRSWCYLEIAYTRRLYARVGVNKAYFSQTDFYSKKNMNFHKQLIQDINGLSCARAETRNPIEKRAIQNLLERELGLKEADRIVRIAILKAFRDRYEEEYGADQISNVYKEALQVASATKKHKHR